MLDANDPKLTAYVLGELDDPEMAAFEADLKRSPELQNSVEEIRRTIDLISNSLQAKPAAALTNAQRSHIGQQAESGAVAAELAPSASGRGARFAIALALTLLLALGGAAIIFAVAGKDDKPIASATNESDDKSALPSEHYASDDASFSQSPTRDFDAGGETSASPDMDPMEIEPSTWDQPAGTANDYDFESAPLPAEPGGFSEQTAPRSGAMTEPSVEGREGLDRYGDSRRPRPSSSSTSNGARYGSANFGYAAEGETAGPLDPYGPSGATPAADLAVPPQAPPANESHPTPAPIMTPEELGEIAGESRGETENRLPAKPQQPASWKRVKAVPNTSRLMIGDHDELPMEGLQANVVVDGFRARVLLDCYFYNNHAQQLEGNFKLRLPDDASLYYFAFGETSFEYRPMVDQLASKGFLPAELVRASGTGPAEILEARDSTWGKVKEARIVPKEKAALAYSETVRRRIDPALVEWSGAGVFNARVFPLMPNKLHRVVIGYDISLVPHGDDLVYRLDLPEQVEQRMVDLNVSALPGTSVEVTPQARPFTSGGRAYYHFKDPHENSIVVRVKDPGTMVLTGSDQLTGDYFATRVTPELPKAESQTGSTHAIFLLDTSLSSNPDKFNVWLKMLETTLEKNRDTIQHFAVLCFNIESHWWKNDYVPNTPENMREALNFCNTLALEGATDLQQALREATTLSTWPVGDRRPTPDLFLLSDGAPTWGELNVHRITTALKSGTGGTLFAYNTGLTGTAVGVLEHLARESGGAVFSIVNEEEVAQAATAHRQRPWQLLNATVTGGSDIFVAGRIRSIYPGQSLLLVGRGKPDGQVLLHVKRGDEQQTINVSLDRTVPSELAPRFYGQVAVGQLEDLGSATEQVAVQYARHFRVTGQTCSLLMLDNEADYQRFNIKPEDDAFTVKSTPAADLIMRKLDEVGEQLDDPKAEVEAWLAKMEQMPGVDFKVPVPLREVLPQIPARAFDIEIPRLECKQRDRSELSKKVFEELQNPQLTYDVIAAEAAERLEKHGPADALKALSSLIENNPGDTVLARDVAFSAAEWGLAGQAYPLLKRVLLSRPHEPQAYQAVAQCVADLGNADLAMVYYEVAMNGNWHNRWQDFNKIVGVEYLHMLHRIDRGELSSSVPQFVKARLDDLSQRLGVGEPNLIVTMMWNTDRTDVDLHVLEPSGEECYYKNPNTRAGGRITADVTEGFGPEMYTLDRGQPGNYTIKANYYGSDANRTQVRSKIHVTVYERFGTEQEKVTKKTVTLNRGKEMRELATVTIEK